MKVKDKIKSWTRILVKKGILKNIGFTFLAFSIPITLTCFLLKEKWAMIVVALFLGFGMFWYIASVWGK